jgi:putative acetyltransferase
MMRIIQGDFRDPRVVELLNIHVISARAETACGSDHALDLAGMQSPDIRFWTVWGDETLLGIGALKRLSANHGEVKSMHTVESARRTGAGSAMLRHIIAAARSDGMTRLSLETGSRKYFVPARAFYKRHGFVECGPFGDYVLDSNSVFMSLDLTKGADFHLVNTRRATIDDAIEACAVLRRSIIELCRLDHGGDDAYLAKWLSNKTVENVRRWISESAFFVAEESTKIVGVAAMSASGKITLNYVSPDARFRGVSKALMLCMEDHARAAGIAECSVESTQTALRFYGALGYARSEQHYTLPLTGSPAIVLTKRLQP